MPLWWVGLGLGDEDLHVLNTLPNPFDMNSRVGGTRQGHPLLTLDLKRPATWVAPPRIYAMQVQMHICWQGRNQPEQSGRMHIGPMHQLHFMYSIVHHVMKECVRMERTHNHGSPLYAIHSSVIPIALLTSSSRSTPVLPTRQVPWSTP